MKDIDYDLIKASFGASRISVLAPRQKEPEIPDVVLKGIAEVNGVAAAEYPATCQGIHFAIKRSREEWLWLQSMRAIAKSGRSIRPVLHAARHLRNALAKLDENAIIALQAQIDAFYNAKKGDDVGIEVLSEGNPAVEHYEMVVAQLMAAASKAVGFQFAKRRAGAPEGRRDHVLELLVEHLQNAIEVTGKGHLTYDRPFKRGSLVKTLESLRPYVEFIPNPLPWRALEEMTSRKTPQKQ